MKYVYLLESISNPDKHYVGISRDLTRHLAEHNNGKSPHTARFRPWKVAITVQFADEQKAAAFEKYLKSGSGHAFAKRHFW